MNTFRGIYILMLLSIVFWSMVAAILATTRGHPDIVAASFGLGLGSLWLLFKASRNKNL